MKNNLYPNYIKCPNCKNVLGLEFIDKECPNPACSFDFKGLKELLYSEDHNLREMLLEAQKQGDKQCYKLIEAAICFNIYNYFAHFIQCSRGSHYNTLFKEFITRYLEDLGLVKKILTSEVIAPKKAIISKNGYKIFWELYKYLMQVNNLEIRQFLIKEFPLLYKRRTREARDAQELMKRDKDKQKQLV